MQKKTRKMVALVLAGALMSGIFAACAKGNGATEGSAVSRSMENDGDTASAEKRSTLVIATESEPPTLHPFDHKAVTATYMNLLTFNALMSIDPETLEPVTDLAESYETVSDTEWVFTLKQGVTFHDGSTLDAQDVKASMEYAKTYPTTKDYTSFWTDIQAVDDTHVKITTDGPYAMVLNDMASIDILPSELIDEGNDFNENPVGTGPYQFVEWVVSSHVDMTRFDGYWGEAPAIKDLRIRFIAESTARTIALETGEIDLASALDDADIESILNGEKEHIVGHLVNGYQTNYVAFNLNFEPFNDIRVRQAIAYGVDWNDVSVASGETSFEPALSLLSPEIQFHKDIGQYEYDPERAKALMEEAGYADGFEITCTEEDVPSSTRALEVLQAYLADLNITMSITVSDTATWIDSLNNGTCDITLISLTSGTGDPSNMYNNMLDTSAMILGRTYDEEFNALAREGLGAMDETERAEVYAELQQYAFDNVLSIPVNHRRQAYGIWDYVEGFYPDPGQLISIKDLSYILE